MFRPHLGHRQASYKNKILELSSVLIWIHISHSVIILLLLLLLSSRVGYVTRQITLRESWIQRIFNEHSLLRLYTLQLLPLVLCSLLSN
jgi:hypothetical protein